jgi:hypothetical protein
LTFNLFLFQIVFQYCYQSSFLEHTTIWGVNARDDILYRPGYEGGWTNIAGKLKQITVGPLGTFGVNEQDEIFYRTGTGEDNASQGSNGFITTAAKKIYFRRI